MSENTHDTEDTQDTAVLDPSAPAPAATPATAGWSLRSVIAASIVTFLLGGLLGASAGALVAKKDAGRVSVTTTRGEQTQRQRQRDRTPGESRRPHRSERGGDPFAGLAPFLGGGAPFALSPEVRSMVMRFLRTMMERLAQGTDGEGPQSWGDLFGGDSSTGQSLDLGKLLGGLLGGEDGSEDGIDLGRLFGGLFGDAGEPTDTDKSRKPDKRDSAAPGGTRS